MKSIISIALAASLALPQIAAAAHHGTPSMSLGGRTKQPIGHYEFCKRNKDECLVKTSVDDVLTYDASAEVLVERVNRQVNDAIAPETDDEVYGMSEFWTYPGKEGDCEDFALLKRRELMAAGISVSNLLITVVFKPNGEGHAVLTVRTDKGDFVLDNLSDDVKHWTDTPYTFVKRQDSRDTGAWVDIIDVDAVAEVQAVFGADGEVLTESAPGPSTR